MFSNADEVLKYLKDNDVKSVDVRFCDLPGVMQHFTVPVSSFDQTVFDDGLNFDGSSIRGFQAIHESDMSLFPDPTTAYIDPFRVAKTLVVLPYFLTKYFRSFSLSVIACSMAQPPFE